MYNSMYKIHQSFLAQISVHFNIHLIRFVYNQNKTKKISQEAAPRDDI